MSLRATSCRDYEFAASALRIILDQVEISLADSVVEPLGLAGRDDLRSRLAACEIRGEFRLVAEVHADAGRPARYDTQVRICNGVVVAGEPGLVAERLGDEAQTQLPVRFGDPGCLQLGDMLAARP